MATNKERPFYHEIRSGQLCLLAEAVCKKPQTNKAMYYSKLQIEMNQRLGLQTLWVPSVDSMC